MTSTDLAARMANNSLADPVEGEPKAPTISDLIYDQVPQIEKAVGDTMTATRLARVVISEIRKNPKLAECSLPSLMGAMLQSAQLGLEPGGALGQCWFVPIRSKRDGLQVEFWMGYKGMLELARRSGKVHQIVADGVRENDEFNDSVGSAGGFHHKVDRRASVEDRGDIYCWYAYASLVGGGEQWVVLSPEEIDGYKARAGKVGDAWKSDYAAMAKKTCVRRLFTWLPSTPFVADALQADERVSLFSAERPELGATIGEVDAPELMQTTEPDGEDTPPLPAGVVVDENGEMWEETD